MSDRLSLQIPHLQLDHDLLAWTGEPMVIKKAVCMHEEDAGILWKHMEYRDGTAEVRRSRRLVISFIATVVNYECTLLPHLALSLPAAAL